MPRTILIGDIHGCVAELRDLLDLVRFQAGQDELIFLGDYVDRGPDSVGALRLVRELTELHGTVALLGNHDEKYIRWHRWQTGGQPPGSTPMQFSEEKIRVYGQLGPDDLKWLATRPYYFQGDGFVAVHAGVSPVKHQRVEDLTRNRECRDLLLRIRQLDAQGKALKLGDPHPPDARPWWQEYDGRFGMVFYGHQRDLEVVRGPFSVGLDTGCCFGGRLTAAIFTRPAELEFQSVKAHALYHPSDEAETD